MTPLGKECGDVKDTTAMSYTDSENGLQAISSIVQSVIDRCAIELELEATHHNASQAIWKPIAFGVI